MEGLRVRPCDDVFQLAVVLKALEPAFRDLLFLVVEYEPGWWTSQESRAWVTLFVDSRTRLPQPTEYLLLTYTNTRYFAESSAGMGNYYILVAERPTDLHRNNWAGYISGHNGFEVAFHEPRRATEVARLLKLANFTTTRFEAPRPAPILSGPRLPPNLRKILEELVHTWDLNEPATKRDDP